jgi:hypothetical protein
MDNLETPEWDTPWQHRCGQDPQKRTQRHVTQEWQNGDTNLLAQDKALIQGTTLPWLLQTLQEHKLAWLAQIRLARLAYATVQDGDTPTNAGTGASEASHTPWTRLRVYQHHHFRAPSIIIITIAAGTGHRSAFVISFITRQQDQAVRLPTLTRQHHQQHCLALEKLQLGQQDLAVSLSLSLRSQPFGIAVGKL